MKSQDRKTINFNLQRIVNIRELLEWHATYCNGAEEFQREWEIGHLIRDEILRRFWELNLKALALDCLMESPKFQDMTVAGAIGELKKSGCL